jgi:hypothetical protein
MTGQQIDVEERAAGAIVASELEGWWEPRDMPGAPEGTHDLDVHAPQGCTVAVEVTSAGDRSLDELRKLLFREIWEAPSLRHDWWLGLSAQPRPQVKVLMRKIVPHLEVLEQNDVAQLSTLDPLPAETSPDVTEVARAILDLRVRRATRLDPPKDGQPARLHSSLGFGFSASSYSFNEVVEGCPAKKADKLRAANADKKHLFIWLRGEAHDNLEFAMATLGGPDAPPNLPDGIDTAWVAIGPPDPAAPTLSVLRVRPPARWEQLRAPRSLADA